MATRVLTRHKIVIAAALLALVGLSSAATLHALPRFGGQPPRPLIGRLALFGPVLGDLRAGIRELGITKAQREQIRGILEEHKPELRALADRGIATRRTLHDAVAADVIDEALIRERSAAVAAVRADAAVMRSRIRAEVFQALTPEQRAKAGALRSRIEQQVDERLKAWLEAGEL